MTNLLNVNIMAEEVMRQQESEAAASKPQQQNLMLRITLTQDLQTTR